MNLKAKVLQISQTLGFQRTVIGALEPLVAEREHFEDWVERGYAAGMDYMKRNTDMRLSPQRFRINSRSAVIVSVSYYSERPELPGPFHGQVARYAVGMDYHAVIRKKLRELRDTLTSELGLCVTGKPFVDDVALYEQGYARRHGLGFAGKNTLIIGPRLAGTYNFVGELFVDVELEPDIPYDGTCGQCFRCGTACPTGAIVEPGYVDSNLCISYLTIENRGGIPLDLRAKLGSWVFGCDICQEVCPYNQRPPETPWEELRPASGIGHYLDLREMLTIKNDDEFLRKFGHTPLRRPKRRGLLRNTLVVLGNRLKEVVSSFTSGPDAPDADPKEVQSIEMDSTKLASGQAVSIEVVSDVVKELSAFAAGETDPMLREHAAWAIAQALPGAGQTGYSVVKSGRSAAKAELERLYQAESDPDCKAAIGALLS